jgi:hypothetical protein
VDISCNFSGISYTNIVTGATASCSGLTASDIDAVNWSTSVYEDDVLAYNAQFFTDPTTGVTPTDIVFTGSVNTAFTTLGYDFTNTGTSFTVENIAGVDNVKVDICIDFDTNTGFTGTCEQYCVNQCDETFSGISSGDTGVYVINTQTGLTFTFDFTANTESFTADTEAIFSYEIYKYNNDIGGFNTNPVISSHEIYRSGMSATSATTQVVTISSLNLDGDYLIKGYYLHNVCTEFANLLDKKYDTSIFKTGDEYGLYNENRDFYFVASTIAQTPILQQTATLATQLGAFIVVSFDLTVGQTEVTIPNTVGDPIVTLNGLTLALDEDYTISGVTGTTNQFITLLSPAVLNDIMTIAYVTQQTDNTLRTETEDITTPIISGATDGQGDNKVYFNTTTGKYEFFLDVTPISGNDISVTLNGATLANNIDYYQSLSNLKRLIFEGDFAVGDIINVYYNVGTDTQGNITIPNPTVGWTIDIAPENNFGEFTVELASDELFTTIIDNPTVGYISGINGYSTQITLSGDVGTKLFYRVKNEKEYITLCNDGIKSIAYSEIVPITVGTNATNNY